MYEKRITKELEEQIFFDYFYNEKYYTYKMLAKQYHIGITTVNEILKKYNVSRRKQRAKRKAMKQHLSNITRARYEVKKKEVNWQEKKQDVLIKLRSG